MKLHFGLGSQRRGLHGGVGEREVNRKPALVLHAGFAKCGNSSIRAALFQNVERLREHGAFVLGKDLTIARGSTDLGTPIWSLEKAKASGETLASKLAGALPAPSDGRPTINILSAENLATPGMAQVLTGLDDEFDLRVVFYVRPQLEWIPSAWKQWGLKKGTSLDAFVSQCLQNHRPAFRAGIETCARTLPAAHIDVRFLIPELLVGGNPVADFFALLGLPEPVFSFADVALNPSLDFAVLHVLSQNPHLFSGPHDNRLMEKLSLKLPEKFRSTNIRMLSREQEVAIEEHFREENHWLLQTYGGGADANEIYRKYFTPLDAQSRYPDWSDIALIYRCLGIILESIAGDSAGSDGGSYNACDEHPRA